MRTHFGKCKGPKEEHKKKKCSKCKASKVHQAVTSQRSHATSLKPRKTRRRRTISMVQRSKKLHGSLSKSTATTTSPEHNSGAVHHSIRITESNSPQKKSKKHAKKSCKKSK